MSYNKDFYDAKRSEVFDRTGTFFAFSLKQFTDQKKEGVKYVRLPAGMICRKDSVNELIDGLSSIRKESIEADLKETGKRDIIIRELNNHEYGYTYDPTDTADALEDYGITLEEIKEVAASMCWNEY